MKNKKNNQYNILNNSFCLAFIDSGESEHIRGTECDQRILSKGESNGTVFSPNYPMPYLPNLVCRYFIYGLQDAQHLERVRLMFSNFSISTNSTPGTGES